MPHRTHIAGLLAMALPWAFGWPPALMLVSGGLGFFASVTGWAAALAGMCVLEPRLIPVAALAICIGVWARLHFPPGALPDTTRTRLLAWLYLVQNLRFWGWGWGAGRIAVEAAWIRSGGRSMEGSPAHNEWLELLYEHGVWAGIGLAVGVALLATHWSWGDPRVASCVAAVVVLSATSPLRGFWKWLHGDRASLWGEPLLASLTVHVQPDGTTHVFGGLHVPKMDAAAQLKIAHGLMSAGKVLEQSLVARNGNLVPAPSAQAVEARYGE